MNEENFDMYSDSDKDSIFDDSDNYTDNDFERKIDKVFFCAKKGFVTWLAATLEDFTFEDKMKLLFERNYSSRYFILPLEMASKYGRDNIVRYLLSSYSNMDMEQECTTKNKVPRTSAVWYAARAGHIRCIEALINFGADVNHSANNGSTPLRVACQTGRYSVVKTLINCGADVNKTNPSGMSCLMTAAAMGYSDICDLLLTNYAEVNAKSICGNTALHYATQNRHMKVVEILINYGAKMLLNDEGVPPYLIAADKRSISIVDYFVNKENLLNRQQKIDIFELLGASFAAAPGLQIRCVDSALIYFRKAMCLRYPEPNPNTNVQPIVITKKLHPPIPAYDNWIECRNLQELEAISLNRHSIDMEALTVRERILGRKYIDLTPSIVETANSYYSTGRVDKAEKLWLHAISINQSNKISCIDNLETFVDVYMDQLAADKGALIHFSTVLNVLRCCMNEPIEQHSGLQKTTLLIVFILTEIIKTYKQNVQSDELFDFYKTVYELIKINNKDKFQPKFLHIACDSSLICMQTENFSGLYGFPSFEVVDLLLKCGADISQVNHNGNTPLHILAENDPIDCEEFRNTLNEIIENILKSFLKYGFHFDTVNLHGQTAAQIAYSDTVASKIKYYEARSLTLKCLAAQCIASNDIPYKKILPKSLNIFVEKHIGQHTKDCLVNEEENEN